jgi:hypothetical protein
VERQMTPIIQQRAVRNLPHDLSYMKGGVLAAWRVGVRLAGSVFLFDGAAILDK